MENYFKKIETYNIEVKVHRVNELTIIAASIKTIVVHARHINSSIKNNLETFYVEMCMTFLNEHSTFSQNNLTETAIKQELQNAFELLHPDNEYKMFF